MNIIFTTPTIKISPLNLSLKTPKLSFKGLKSDTFEKSADKKLPIDLSELEGHYYEKEIIEALKKAPSCVLKTDGASDILFDEYLSLKEKEAAAKNKEFNKAYRNYCKQTETQANISSLEQEKNDVLNELKMLKIFANTDTAKQLIFAQHEKRNPNVGFLYNPSLSDDEKQKMLDEKPEIINVSDSSCKYYTFMDYWHDNGLFDFETFNNEKYVDVSVPSLKEFLDDFEEKRKGMPTLKDISKQYNIYESKLNEMLRNRQIELIGTLPNANINQISAKRMLWPVNINSDTTKKTLDRCSKTIPTEAGKYYKGLFKDAKPVPAGVLSKLGFGSLKELAKLVQNGTIKGKIYSKADDNGKKTYKVFVDINDDKTENILKTLRRENENVSELKPLAKFLGMSPCDLEDYFAQGKGTIVKHYIFSDDYNKVFVNLKDPENKELLDKVNEKKMAAIDKEIERIDSIVDKRRQERLEAIEADIKKLEKSVDFSLRMKLVWHFCDNVKKTASDLASHDPYLASLFEKIEEGKEELTPEEKHDYLSYCKSIWGEDEKQEFKEAFKTVAGILKTYKTQGIDAIDDPIIKQIIINHNAELE